VERRKLMCTLNEALEAIRTVNPFYEARSEKTKIISEIGKIEDDLEKQYWTKRKQKKIRFLHLNIRKFVILLYVSCSISYFNKFNIQEISLKLSF
jgi:hypothetical protein